MQITVVDNNSKAEKLAQLEAALPPDVDLLKLERNVGWGAAHNTVLRRWLKTEQSEYFLASAHDALPLRDCLKQLLAAMNVHARWGMVCPEYGQAELPRYNVLRGARLLPTSKRRSGAHEEIEFCHGTLAVFRRQCLEEIGLYDERYFAYGDETEIGIRARRTGWKVGLVWGAIVVNPGSWSGNAVIAYLWTRNSLLLARQYGGVAGMLGRLAIVLAVTAKQRLRGAARDSMSSPAGRMRGVEDYLRGYVGGPPADVLTMCK
jgi:GT2 family glycosyltransferase